jgi:hypothetical protein
VIPTRSRSPDPQREKGSLGATGVQPDAPLLRRHARFGIIC